MQTKTINLALPRPHEGRTLGGQARILREARRYNVLDMGRRFGKTDLCQIVIAPPLLDGYPVGWFAPTYKILDDAWQEISRLYQPIIKRKSDTDKVMDFITGGRLEAWTMDREGAGRSRKYKRVVIDEAARVDNLVDKFNFDIRPCLLDYSGDAFFASTPKGLNDYFKIWQMAENDPEWARWKMPTHENPYIELAEIEAMRLTMPDRVYRQEILAEFLENGSFFQGVEAACTLTEMDAPANHKGHPLYAGLDWALSEDYTVLTILCGMCGKVVYWYRVNRMDYTMQRAQIVEILSRWPGVITLPERNSIGVPNIEMLIAAGVNIGRGMDGGAGFNTTSASKGQLIQRLATSIEKGELLLPLEYADELRAYEVTITTGNPKFSAPTGQHDDRVISAALAWWAASSGYATDWSSLPEGRVENYVNKWS